MCVLVGIYEFGNEIVREFTIKYCMLQKRERKTITKQHHRIHVLLFLFLLSKYIHVLENRERDVRTN